MSLDTLTGFLDNEFFHNDFFGLTGRNWTVFAGLFLVFLLTSWLVLQLVRRRLKAQEEKSQADGEHKPSFVSRAAGKTSVLGIVGVAIVLAAFFHPDLDPGIKSRFYPLGVTLLLLQVGYWLVSMLDSIVLWALRLLHVQDESAATAMGVLRFFGLVAIWSIVLLSVLANMGVAIGPLIAGLGVGGIAIAFALQQILGDIFSAVAIVLDRPFEVGDFIIVGSELGSIEKIGIKTTRVRSLGGEQIIVSNADMLNSRVRNYKRMKERRVVFRFGILYSTPSEKLEVIPGWVKEIVQNIEQTRFDRAHFFSFGASSLDFEVVYYVLSPDYTIYMNIQEKINLALVRRFRSEGITFAYPSTSLYVEQVPPLRIQRVNEPGEQAS